MLWNTAGLWYIGVMCVIVTWGFCATSVSTPRKLFLQRGFPGVSVGNKTKQQFRAPFPRFANKYQAALMVFTAQSKLNSRIIYCYVVLVVISYSVCSAHFDDAFHPWIAQLAQFSLVTCSVCSVQLGSAQFSIVHYEYLALAKKTSVLQKTMLSFVEASQKCCK